ncbi:MAG: glycosyl hydrolase family 8 [Thermodesulfobacteriota bacterium]
MQVLVFIGWVLMLLSCFGCGEKAGLDDLPRILHASWQSYRQHSISPEGRVVLAERDGGTISEAQAYALLRAVWAGDQETFARVYAWTYINLSRAGSHGDHLLAWHWGPREDGAWGVLDWNSASDGDLDYTLALTLAARRGWRPPAPLPDYATQARQVQQDILAKEVATLPAGELLLLPGNWQPHQPPLLLNPSYFSPGTYRLLAQAFQEPRWLALRQDTYPLLKSLARGLGPLAGVGLFPDWCRLDAAGQLAPAPGRNPDFGWEALRLPWRVALDSLWFGEKEAAALLAQQFLPFIKKTWQSQGRLAAIYSYTGKPLATYESPVIYAGVLAAALAAKDQDFARQMAGKILSFYQEKDHQSYFATPDNYYANNWAWLGLALYAGWARNFEAGGGG